MVRDPAVHQAVCETGARMVGGAAGLDGAGGDESPITGPEGNKEFLIAASLTSPAGAGEVETR